jgi:hypothetical protein
MKLPGADKEERVELLHELSRRIVATREITPRNPRWQRMWKKTLLRYVDTLHSLREDKEAQGDR